MGVKTIIVFLNKCDIVDDEEMHELFEIHVRKFLSAYVNDGNITLRKLNGTALKLANRLWCSYERTNIVIPKRERKNGIFCCLLIFMSTFWVLVWWLQAVLHKESKGQ